MVYVEADLFLQEAETLSVIVTAADSAAAAQAVESVGGQVTSDLWRIDAVAANIPALQLDALVASPEVHSIAGNKSVESAYIESTDSIKGMATNTIAGPSLP